MINTFYCAISIIADCKIYQKHSAITCLPMDTKGKQFLKKLRPITFECYLEMA